MERVLGEVGDAVVFAGVNRGRVGRVRRGCAVEGHIQEWDIEAREALEDTADGVVGITNQHEGQLALVVRARRHESRYFIGGDRGALRVAENENVV